MNYTNLVLKHPEYLRLNKQIKALEADRIYCGHDLSHALDVCRIAWIAYLEEQKKPDQAQLAAQKDRIYVCALLHDIGRAAQYQTGQHHAQASVELAKRIFADIGYPEAWQEEDLAVIGSHHGRTLDGQRAGGIASYIQQADHLSRNCFACEATDSCKWKDEERNTGIRY